MKTTDLYVTVSVAGSEVARGRVSLPLPPPGAKSLEGAVLEAQVRQRVLVAVPTIRLSNPSGLSRRLETLSREAHGTTGRDGSEGGGR